jgi:triosephosphate isomerase
MRKLFIAGNWKMNLLRDEAAELTREIIREMDGCTRIDVALFPSFVLLPFVIDLTEHTPVFVGAQNVFSETSGAYTGEISPLMLRDTGCAYVIIGHSERRQHFSESDRFINRKVKASIERDLVPVLCIGETSEERRDNRTAEVLSRQLTYGLEGIDNRLITRMVIAYEPVWAIGTGVSATGDQAQKTHEHIRYFLRKFTEGQVAEDVRIIYGGSVTPGNARYLLEQNDIDGALVGGASLTAGSFCEIVKIADSLESRCIERS